MKVKEFFKLFNSNFIDEFTIYLHDTTENTVYRDSLESITANDDLHSEWKNAIVLEWSIQDKEFLMFVEKRRTEHELFYNEC